MGWLPQFRPPERYNAVWMQKLIEGIRTALNFTIYRTCIGTPSLTPDFVGEEVLDTTNKMWYKSVGLTSADWKLIT